MTKETKTEDSSSKEESIIEWSNQIEKERNTKTEDWIDFNNVKAGDAHVGLFNATNKCLMAITEDELKEARNLLGREINQYVKSLATKIHEDYEREARENYLSYFRYEDWDVGDDDKLRVGDYINLNYQRGYDGYEQNLVGKIVLHDDNQLPVVLYNIEPKTEDEEESGEYGDLQDFFMNGWTLSRIKNPHLHLRPREY